MTVYAIGDIHGQLDMLRAAHDRIAADKAREGTADATVVHIGDFVDRGPDAKGTLDWLISASADGAPYVFIRGNHDRLMEAFLDPDAFAGTVHAKFNWLQENLGGALTLASYGVATGPLTRREKLRAAALDAIPEKHRAFLAGLTPYHHEAELCFVHAGIRPGVPLDQQSDADLIWIRSDFLDDLCDHGPLIIHGHTPVLRIEHMGNRLNIDTGAGFGHPLSAVAIEGRCVFELTGTGRTAVT